MDLCEIKISRNNLNDLINVHAISNNITKKKKETKSFVGLIKSCSLHTNFNETKNSKFESLTDTKSINFCAFFQTNGDDRCPSEFNLTTCCSSDNDNNNNNSIANNNISNKIEPGKISFLKEKNIQNNDIYISNK